MSTPNLDSDNPYQAPAPDVPWTPASPASATVTLFRTLKEFRSQIVALGVFWVLLGSLAIIAGVLVAFDDPRMDRIDITVAWVELAIIAGLGLIWIGLGIATCLKQLWAVYAGLVLSYLGLVGNLASFNLCGLAILGIGIFQAHRVIKMAGRLQAAGVPLTTRPEQLQVPLALPTAPFSPGSGPPG